MAIFKCFHGMDTHLDDIVLAVHHSFKCLAEDLNVLKELSGLNFSKNGSPLCIDLIKVQSAVVLLLGQLVLCEGVDTPAGGQSQKPSPSPRSHLVPWLAPLPFVFSEGPNL